MTISNREITSDSKFGDIYNEFVLIGHYSVAKLKNTYLRMLGLGGFFGAGFFCSLAIISMLC